MPGSGPNNGVLDASFARSSAVSLPVKPLWPGIQVRQTWQLLVRAFSASLHSKAKDDENLLLARDLIAAWLSMKMFIGLLK